MTKTTKLWIRHALELRHAINGWPKSEDYVTVHDGGQHGSFDDEGYQKALAKAKEESILVEQSDNTPITMFKGVLEPDEFIDFEGDVEVVCQQRRIFNGGWTDCSEEHYKSQYRSFPKLFRQVARLKPVQSNPVVIPDQSDYATEEEFFEACRRQRRQVIPMNEEETMTDAEMNEALKALKDPIKKELEAAKARINELEAQNKHMADLLAKYSENE